MVKCGVLVKAEVDLYDDATVRLWTPELRKAINTATKFKLKIVRYEDEADLFIPVVLWPKLSKRFGISKILPTR